MSDKKTQAQEFWDEKERRDDADQRKGCMLMLWLMLAILVLAIIIGTCY